MTAIISPISTVLLAYQKYINALANECIKKLSPDDNIRKYYSHTFIDEYFDSLKYQNSDGEVVQHGFSTFMMTVFVLILIFLLVALVVGSFFIQINVLVDVINQPSSSYYINLFVVSIAIASILFSWVVSIIQLPMPEVDISNYSKLSEMEANDPDKYKEIMRRMAKESSKKDELSTLILSAVVYVASFSAINIYYFPDSFDDLSVFLGKAMTGFFITLILSTEIIRFITRKGWAWYFRKYSETEQRMTVFSWLKRLWLNRPLFTRHC